MSLPNYLQHGGDSVVKLGPDFPGIEVPTVHNAEYELALLDVMKHGVDREDRTGTGTRSLFGLRMEFDLQNGFPLITTKRVFWKGVVEELLWMLRGETNIKSLQSKGVHIWDAWASESGELGPVYGAQWRSWSSGRVERWQRGSCEVIERPVDQIADVIAQIKGNPQSRRLIVSAWNPTDIPNMALPPCHMLFQFYVTNDWHLDCQLYQRSADMFLGVPFNIASYSLLTHIIAAMTGLKPGRFIHTIGDAHIYRDHFDQVIEQLGREPRPFPELDIAISEGDGNRPGVTDPGDFQFGDFVLTGYKPHAAIKGEVSV